jgi:hypothetical protein
MPHSWPTLGVAVCDRQEPLPTECFNPNAAVMRAEALSRKEDHVGAVAFSRTGDPATGDFSDATVLRKFGDVPDDLSALLRDRASRKAAQRPTPLETTSDYEAKSRN